MIRTKIKFMGRQLVEIIFPCLYDGLLYFDWNSVLANGIWQSMDMVLANTAPESVNPIAVGHGL